MCATITLGLWQTNQRIKLENVDLESKAELLKSEAAKRLEGQMDGFELSYCGHIIEDGRTLSSYGIRTGSLINVLNKIPVSKPRKGHKLTEHEVQQLVKSFVTFKMSRVSASFRTAIQRLSRPEILEKIIAATPGLSDDPVALAIIQDPELLIQMAQPDTISRVAEEHPALIEAAHYIAAHIHDEQANLTFNQASTSTGYSYSLEALSDDEDMDSSSSDTNREPQPLARNSSYNAITAAQLAAAIANATNTAFNTNSAGVATNAGGAGSSSGRVITSEMFNTAMQQAFRSSLNAGASAAPTLPSAVSNRGEDNIENVEGIMARWQTQLQQMHEMGLMNDPLNVRALQATNGDVRAAIELVFSNVLT